ncbi:hypothetical protein ABW20_dc0106848 [Dactylellina cionopaga]|nr:hypothetical protein ABW20_dc0106848 [Dactylellina cionopaga]
MYKANIKVAGIIYLHDITEIRMGGTAKKLLGLLKNICGEEAYSYIVLGTSKWGKLTDEEYMLADERERYLKTREEYWGPMCRRGAKVMRWHGDKNTARSLVEHLVVLQKGHGGVVLKIQKEIIDQKQTLGGTSAGREIKNRLSQLQETQEGKLEDINQEYIVALKTQEKEEMEEILAERRELEEKLQKSVEAQKRLEERYEKLASEKAAEFAVLLEEYKRRLSDVNTSDLSPTTTIESKAEPKPKVSKRERLARALPLLGILVSITSAAVGLGTMSL